MHRFGASGVLHILDDFLFIAKTETKCRSDLSNFLRLCDYLGVPIAQEKTVGPSQVIQFAGITLDSVRQEARLPEDKLQKCRLLLQSFYKRRKVTLRELQSLLGLLNFTCSVIVPGRPFLRRMIDLTVGVRRAALGLAKGPNTISRSGSISSMHLMAVHFSTMTYGTHLLSLSCIRTQLHLRVTGLFWASVGFLAIFLIRGNLLISPS